MPLTQKHKDKILELIIQDKAAADIYNEIVRDGADYRDVSAEVAEQQTLKGRLNSITRIAKQFEAAGTAERRKELGEKVIKIAKGSVKALQQQARNKDQA
ncbi:hypothetical protein AVME950_17605 [Acidovorax sp. SUPP950]|uniref:hypothetical protein n=1 Tax=Acidovorax sp. SUPP950 TaxID=511901 RepID=UPI0023D70432|nr:hypothetical protein [Acidovorax sp. SUPP950]GKS76739.1 hypothetical protein AVME950_17605 [Acidovorax sp. SUPP950]